MLKCLFFSFFKTHPANALAFGIAEVLAYVHGVGVVSVFQHSRGDSGRGMLPISQYTYFVGMFYECFVQLLSERRYAYRRRASPVCALMFAGN